MKNKPIILACLFACFLLLAACNTMQAAVTTDSGQNIEIKSNVPAKTMQAGLGSWCQAGAKWSVKGDEGAADMAITGIENFKGEEYCHATMKADDPEEGTSTAVDYYFKKDNMDIWMVIQTPDGNKIEQHVAQGE